VRPGHLRYTRAAGLLVCVIALLIAFRWLAAELTAIHLANEAGRVLHTLRQGEPRWQWQPREPEDLVAGRVFGDGRVKPAQGGLEITSGGTTPFELGLPVARRLDLMHWPILALASSGTAIANVSVMWRDEDGTACLTSPQIWHAGATLRIDLHQRPGLDPRDRPCPLPINASMLRLRISAPAGTSWVLQRVALESMDPGYEAPRATIRPDPLPAVDAQLAALDGSTASPLVWLPEGARAEQLLAWRDQATDRQAGAIVIRADLPPHADRPVLPNWLSWLAGGIYFVALLHLARRPRGDLITLAAALAGPLWLLAGLQWGGRASWPAAAAFASALAFAAWSTRDKGLRQWCWLGRWKSAMWWAPLLLAPVAVAVGQLWGHPMEPVKPGRAVIYLGWAALQQWLLLGFALPRLERVLPSGPWAILAVATLFALMHTPNGTLMQLCLLAELAWATCFTRTRSLLPIAIAHAASALIAGATLVGPVLRSLEVSGRFFF